MQFSSMSRCAAPWLLAAALLGSGLAMAQAEPTLNQIYEAAQAAGLPVAVLYLDALAPTGTPADVPALIDADDERQDRGAA